jgi:uncharacterized protein
LTLFSLYACAASLPPAPVAEKSAPSAPVNEKPLPTPLVSESPALPAVITEMPPLLPPAEGKPVPHIALLLPLKSAVFGSAADVVQQGFMAAVSLKKGGLPIRAYPDIDENGNIIATYRQAIANGARAVVGPLTRNGVAALAAESYIPIPTLALNVVESQPAQQLYFFGMAAEAEARQVAQLASRQGLHQAIVIATRAQLSQRLQLAFEEEWHSSGGAILREIEFNDDPESFADITETPDMMIFLATNAEKARLIRPYLSNKLPIYSTSQIFTGNDNTLTNYDLNGIRFIDVPWLLQPDHPAVMIYPRASTPLSADSERLYALGIDAYRLVQLLLANKIATALPLDGVSGNIQLHGHVFTREPIPAVFQQGRAQLPDAPSTPAPDIFPARVINVP